MNVNRLKTKQIPASVPIFCTTYGMTSTEVLDCVNPAFPNHGYFSPNGTYIAPKGNNGAAVSEAGKIIKEFLRERIQVFR